MDEEREELLQDSEDDSISETDDQCLPEPKLTGPTVQNPSYVEHSRTHFILSKLLLILSTLSVLILFPLYIETINVSGDVYGLLLSNTIFSTITFVLLTTATKFFQAKKKPMEILKLPVKFTKLGQLSIAYFSSAILITYAMDRKRVVCHLQDPMKGLVLVLSFFCYFFFCQRLMCVKRIFSVTTVIVGLFISVDYSVCNEFKCRGHARQHISDEKGNWSWGTHAVWTSIYVGGLALYAVFFTLLERSLASSRSGEFDENTFPIPVSTVSESVLPVSACSSTQNVEEERHSKKEVNVIDLATWIHVFGVAIVFVLYFSDFIPHIRKGSSGAAVWNYTVNGFLCHFSNAESCYGLPKISWLFTCTYVVFVLSSLQFLKLTQSAVYTVATMATALPLLEIWWSFFNMTPVENGLIIWNPLFTGELVSTFLGLPMMAVGLYFLYKLHSIDCRWSAPLVGVLK